MLEILSSAEQGMQNVYTPLSSSAHFVFCLIATVVYLTQFYRRGSWHYIVIMAAIDITFATQTSICDSSGEIALLGVIEVLLLALAALLSFRFNRAQKAALAEKIAAADEEIERRQLAEKIQRAKEKKMIDNAFEDGDD